MTYYNTEKVLEIMKDYHVNTQAIKNWNKEYASVGVGQYGIEAAMPRANTISNPVENEAIRQMEDVKHYADIQTDIKYLNDRLYRVPNEYEYILGLRLLGYSVTDIQESIGKSRGYVHNRLIRIAKSIVNELDF